MKRDLRLRLEIVDDIVAAAEWYDRQRHGLGDEFVTSAFSAIDTIAARADSFPVVHKGVRRAMMKRFPYAIYFRTDDPL